MADLQVVDRRIEEMDGFLPAQRTEFDKKHFDRIHAAIFRLRSRNGPAVDWRVVRAVHHFSSFQGRTGLYQTFLQEL